MSTNKRKNGAGLKIIGIVAVVGVVGVGIISAFSSHSSGTSPAKSSLSMLPKLNDNATGDTPVETLKTLTATVSTVQDQNKKILDQANASQQQNQQAIASFEQSINQKLDQQISQVKVQNAQYQNQLNTQVHYSLGNAEGGVGSTSEQDRFIWVSDLQSETTGKVGTATLHAATGQADNSNVLNQSTKPEQKQIPYYTIPMNSTLTGVIAMQPILGEVPIDNHVVDPYQFKMVIGADNLAANGIDIPSNIQGIVASGTAQGSLIGPIDKQACVRGTINSMTFVFNDGRISTTTSKGTEGLGIISDDQGYPCIPGILETNAPEYLGITFGLGALQGFAQGVSQAQMSTGTSTAGTTMSTMVGSYSKYAMGQGASSGAAAVQQWFNQRMQNSTDLVVVSNVDPDTHQYRHFNINITRQIEINYNPNARKVSYEHPENNNATTASLD
jgi:hypothetical protein